MWSLKPYCKLTNVRSTQRHSNCPCMRTEMIERLHCNHGGIQATLRRARDVFYWPGMNQEIEKFVASCSICSAYQSVNQKEPLMCATEEWTIW